MALRSQISRRQDGEGAIMGFIVHDTAKQVIGIADVNLGITLFFTKLEHILVPSLLKETAADSITKAVLCSWMQ